MFKSEISMKHYCIATMLCFSTFAYAANSSLNLSVPSPSSSYSSDRFRAGELDCQNAIGGGTNLEFGVTGIITKETDVNSPSYGDRLKDVGVFARITIPLDGAKERVNCNTLYELELRKRRIEVEKLQMELNQLRSLQFEK